MGIGCAHRHNDVSQLDVECRTERLLNPELFQRHFAAALYLAFVFASFAFLYLDGTFRTAVLKLNLAAHRPALAEVVPQHDDDVRQVKTSVTLRVFIRFRTLIPQ